MQFNGHQMCDPINLLIETVLIFFWEQEEKKEDGSPWFGGKVADLWS